MKKNAQGCFFMENSYRRHDMSDAMWEILKPYTIGNKGTQKVPPDKKTSWGKRETV